MCGHLLVWSGGHHSLGDDDGTWHTRSRCYIHSSFLKTVHKIIHITSCLHCLIFTLKLEHMYNICFTGAAASLTSSVCYCDVVIVRFQNGSTHNFAITITNAVYLNNQVTIHAVQCNHRHYTCTCSHQTNAKPVSLVDVHCRFLSFTPSDGKH